jgi:hypothetical protein
MAAQAQAQAASMSHQGPDNGPALNGAQRHSGDGNGAMRDQPQPHIHPHSAPQPHIQPPMQAQPHTQSNALEDIPEFLQTPVREAGKEGTKGESAPIDADPARRRRKRYTANGTGRSAAADDAGPDSKPIEVPGEDRPSDEALI